MGTHEGPLRQRFCRGIDCGRVFWICRHCYRGHKYCSLRCRQKTRGQQIRTAKRKHQKSQEGRDDHRDRNRAYRARRRRQRVTYHTSPAPSDSDSIDPTEPSPSENGPGSVSGEARYAVHPEIEPACIICGRTPSALMPKLDKDTFLKVCPDIARKYFSDALQEAARQGLYVKWATQSFSLWVPLENGKDAELFYGWKDGSIQAYLKKVSDDKKRQDDEAAVVRRGIIGWRGSHRETGFD